LAERFDEDRLELDAAEHASDPFAVVPAPAASGGAWPANVPGMVEAADALGRGLQGSFVPGPIPFAAVAEVVEELSPIEQAVLSGEPQPVDADLIRRAAVMRVRVAAALATAPQAPTPGAVDPGAVSALLAELDALLADVSALVSAAPAELQPSLEQVRNALVKEAIDFSEAAHRAAGAEVPPQAQPGVTSAAERKAAQTRIVSVASKAARNIEAAEARRRNRVVVALVVSCLLAGAFHGWRYLEARDARRGTDRQARPGVPADAVASSGPGANAPILVQTKNGRPFTAEDLKRMEEAAARRGSTVRAAGPSSVFIVPSAPRAPSPEPAAGSAPAPAPAPASHPTPGGAR
jgi:hypothetical protein